MAFLPISKKELLSSEQLDFIYISGDAYVDHPSFGVAVISRIVESCGFKIAIIPQPLKDADYQEFGKPKFAFLVGSGVVDSMVNNYTASKKTRSSDVYSEGGVSGKRPDRALTVYCKNLKRLFPSSAIIVGGMEASLRRFAHYDYWADKVMQSVLTDTQADLLIYGMGENPFFDILRECASGKSVYDLKDICGTCRILKSDEAAAMISEKKHNGVKLEVLPDFSQVCNDKIAHCKAFNLISQNTDARNAFVLIQKQSEGCFVLQNIPASPLTVEQMDKVASLPFERAPHPSYLKGVPAINEVKFSISSHKGCFGGCSFCSLNFHQGRAIQSRSKENIVEEAIKITEMKDFKGYIHDIGGPSANFYRPSCAVQAKNGLCKNKQCIGCEPCINLRVSHKDYLDVLRTVRVLPKIKKVFVRSGVRFDYVLMDKDKSFFNELCEHHISGQLKIAPEHTSSRVLKLMNKPTSDKYQTFAQMFKEKNERLGKNQFLVPYFISSHPGCTEKDALDLTHYLQKINYCPEQVQDFYPTPSTRSTVAFCTGIDPVTMNEIFVARTFEEKQIQRALLQWRRPEYKNTVNEIEKKNESRGFKKSKNFKKTKNIVKNKKNIKPMKKMF